MMLIYFLDIWNIYISSFTAFILLLMALYLTIRTQVLQIRKIPYCIRLLIDGTKTKKISNSNSINPLYALFTAMSTSLGMGTIVGPSIAIMMGGPGGLFWLTFYAFSGAVIKFAEATFGIHFRAKTPDGKILGGPMEYLKYAHPFLAQWYAYASIFLFSGWSALQSNVLAEMFSKVAIPEYITGILLALLVFILLSGGAQRIGEFNSKLVPIMFILYVSVALYILLLNLSELPAAISLIINHAFNLKPALSGIVGYTFMQAVSAGVYKGAFITESGLGTAAIPHSMADVEKPTDQGILAMTSVFVDTFLCLLSGLLIIITNVWFYSKISNTLIYDVFQLYFPAFGHYLLIICITMFVFGTILGNSFNGRQSFASITQYKWLTAYAIFVCICIFFGAINEVVFVWQIIESILPFVAIPHILGLFYLTLKYKSVLRC